MRVCVIMNKDGVLCGVCSSLEKANEAISRLNEIESLNPRDYWYVIEANVDGINANYS